jgi:transposase-like protein
MTKRSPFRHFKTSPEIIHPAVMPHILFPLCLRNVEDLLQERGIEISHKTVRYWWNRFGPMFAADLMPVRAGIQAKRYTSLRAIAAELAAGGIRTLRGEGGTRAVRLNCRKNCPAVPMKSRSR